MTDRYLPTSELYGSPRRDCPDGAEHGDARMGADQDTSSTGKAQTPAVGKVRWEELPQRRRDEINQGMLAFIGLSVEELDAMIPGGKEMLYDVESEMARYRRELEAQRISRGHWWEFWK